MRVCVCACVCVRARAFSTPHFVYNFMPIIKQVWANHAGPRGSAANMRQNQRPHAAGLMRLCTSRWKR